MPAPRTKKPSYLFVLPWDLHHVGGVNQVVENLAEEVALDGRYQPLLLVCSWNDVVARHKKGKLDQIYCRLPSPWGNAAHALKFLVLFPLIARSLTLLISRHHIEVINVHYVGLYAFVIAVLKALGLYRGKLIFSFHGADLTAARQARGLERIYFDYMLGRADGIVACSSHLAAQLRDSFPKGAGRITFVQNGLDVDRFLSNQRSSSLLPSELRCKSFILTIGKFEPKKGQDVLLKAFRRLACRHPELALVMIGASGPSLLSLRQLICSMRMESRVFIYTDVPHHQVLAFLKSAMVFALPSRDEPFGIVLLEAGAAHLPVVASRVGGIPEIIIDGDSGLLFASEDVAALAAKLDELICDPERRCLLARGLYRRVGEHFTWRRAYDGYMRLVDTSRKAPDGV